MSVEETINGRKPKIKPALSAKETLNVEKALNKKWQTSLVEKDTN